MCPTCSSFRETSQKKQKKQKGEKMGQKKKLLVAKLMCRCLDRNTRQHPAVCTHKNKRSTFFGVKLLLYNSIRYGYLWILLLQINLLFPSGGLDSFFNFIFKKYLKNIFLKII